MNEQTKKVIPYLAEPNRDVLTLAWRCGACGPCRKVGKRSYVFVGNEKRFTVGSIYVEVAQGWQA